MANWYYYNESGDKVGPIRGRDLKQLVKDGTITRDTLVENEEGKQGKAGQVNGLMFSEAATPESTPPLAEPNPFTVSLPANNNPFTVAVPQSVSVSVAGKYKNLFIFGIAGILLLLVIGGAGLMLSFPRFTAAEQEEIDEFCEEYGTEEYGTDVNAVNNDGETLLHIAVMEDKSVAVAKYLVSKGANVNAKTKNGYTPLYCAPRFASIEVVKYLISKGADVNARSENGHTPLHVTAERKNTEFAKYLISKGADVNARSKNGSTPLYKAASRGNIEVAKYLVSKGADVNAKNNSGWTPLHDVAFNGNIEFVKYLVSKGADVNAKSESGETPLDVAKGKKNMAVIEYLESLTNK